MYKDGQMDGEYFYSGGEPNNATYTSTTHRFLAAVALLLQRQDKVGHRIFTIDYTATIEIEGGATLTFHGDGQNGRMITNFAKLVVLTCPLPRNRSTVNSSSSMLTDIVEVK